MSNLFTAVSVEQQEIVAGGRKGRNIYTNNQRLWEKTGLKLVQKAGRNGPSTDIEFNREIESTNDLTAKGNFLNELFR